ncbi:hypothetical protein T459_16797 [Capsicum annuum]|uniref:Protein kinase domain-containing protein n=1 Tax=Capsicum annuum TaxID=4072 RepID=A0A2G2ZA45_CAPAN|nr:hypothetical protein T459_16797 [Capsicum annuum]
MLKMGPPCMFFYSRVMHDLHLIYTDLKPENILLTFPEYVKVPDYKVLDGPTLVIYGVLGVSLWNFVRYALFKLDELWFLLVFA